MCGKRALHCLLLPPPIPARSDRPVCTTPCPVLSPISGRRRGRPRKDPEADWGALEPGAKFDGRSNSNYVAQPYRVVVGGTIFSGNLYVSGGFEFVVGRNKGKVMYLVCRRYKKAGIRCPARAKLIKETDQFFVSGEHNCHMHVEYAEEEEEEQE